MKISKEGIAARIAVLAVVAFMAIPGWQIAADMYRRDHGCAHYLGEWWGVPEFDSAWFCPYDANRMSDTGYLMRVLHAHNYPELSAKLEAETAKIAPVTTAPASEIAAFDRLQHNLDRYRATVDPPRR